MKQHPSVDGISCENWARNGVNAPAFPAAAKQRGVHMVVVKRPSSPDYEPEVKSGTKVDIPTPNARQGVTEHKVRYVLAISLGIAIVVLAGAYLLFFAG